MAYLYSRNANGDLVHNRLNSVNDLGTAAGMPTGTSAYTYDRVGRLARDVRENLRLRWTVDNKISQVLKNGSVFVHYLYDAAGNRVMKRLPNDTLEMILRDGTGVELQRITRRSNTNLRIEGMVLGSEHMGTQQLPLATTPDTVEARIANSAAYELSDHLGNVRVTVSDLKTFTALSASSYSLTARATSATDYYPFGLPSRSFQPGYKWGFNGKENDRELLTGGRMQDYGFRAYRPDLGRFFAVDPLKKDYPELTTYQFASNTPIQAIDLDGLEMYVVTYYYSKGLPGSVAVGAIRDKTNGKLMKDMNFSINGQKLTNSKIYIRHLNEDGSQFKEPEQRNVLNTVEKVLVGGLKPDKGDDVGYTFNDQKNGNDKQAETKNFDPNSFELVKSKENLKFVSGLLGDNQAGTSPDWLKSGTKNYLNGEGQLIFFSNANNLSKKDISKNLKTLNVKLIDVIFGKKDQKRTYLNSQPLINTYKIEKK